MIVTLDRTAAATTFAAGESLPTMPLGGRAVACVVRRHRSVISTTPQLAGSGATAAVLGATAGFDATGPTGISAWSPPT